MAIFKNDSKGIADDHNSDNEIADAEVLKKDIEAGKEKLESIRTESETALAELQKINAEIKTAENKLEELKKKNDLEEERFVKLQSELENEKEQIMAEKELVLEKEKTVNQKIENNNAEMAIKEKEIGYREREVSSKLEQLEKKEKYYIDLETKVVKRENELSDKEIEYSQKESAVTRLSSELETKEKIVKELEEAYEKKLNEVIQRENALLERETALNTREASEKEILAAKKLEFEKNVQEEKKTILDALNEEIAQKRKENYDQINKENEALKKELADRERKLTEKELEIEADKEAFAFEKQMVEAEKNNNIRNSRNIELLVENKLKSEQTRMSEEKDSWERQRSELYNKINEYESKMLKFEKLVERFGDNPQAIYDEFRNKQDRINELNQEIMNFDKSKVLEYDNLLKRNGELEEERENYMNRYHEARSKLGEIDDLKFDNEALALSNRTLEKQKADLEDEIKFYKERISRLSTSADPADRDSRIAEIKKGILPALTEELQQRSVEGQPESEIEWLIHIENKCKEYGIKFPRRILYAFHTSLKISDWSTITVLAGVSGTGKSELPRLYSKFGGISFINVPVQPNWDSKESMLGYYNSIDNRFEAQDVLRFLAQCTDPSGYGECMAIVLLDEMNLAHVELYFAEFLSKLEERRGIKKKNSIPEIEVKLGSGMEPYGVKMARNVLWTGTMNQDETTNSLSDKVLDRGIVINFPRPTELISRKEMKDMNDAEPEPLLLRKTWNDWVTRKINFEGKQAEKIEEYRGVVNRINTQLEKVGRALGHRVWQAIEYYIANYPSVILEMKKIQDNPGLEPGTATSEFKASIKTAFEDQIVQKIMPKLRGIETSGIGGEVLDEIKSILCSEGFDTLEEDYKRAMELGYGQFMWNSAKYIENSEEFLAEETEMLEHEDSDSDERSEIYQKNESDFENQPEE